MNWRLRLHKVVATWETTSRAWMIDIVYIIWGSLPNKLRLTNHCIGGCPTFPLSTSGAKLEFPVYLELETAKQGNDLKKIFATRWALACRLMNFDSGNWLKMNPKLAKFKFPFAWARVQGQYFLEATFTSLTTITLIEIDAKASRKSMRPEGTIIASQLEHVKKNLWMSMTMNTLLISPFCNNITRIGHAQISLFERLKSLPTSNIGNCQGRTICNMCKGGPSTPRQHTPFFKQQDEGSCPQ